MQKKIVLAALIASRLGAQQAREPRPIQDNSFLLEEAYNQEPAVVQHINNLFFDRRASTWVYALTDEWPLGGQRHQLSVTLPLHSSQSGGPLLGDVAVNYRLQLVGSGDTRLAVTPRLTAFAPTAAQELGGGTFAMQAAIASSYEATPRLVLHTNAGVTYAPRTGSADATVDLLGGQSVVWLLHPRVNLLVESVVTHGDATAITISPGIRWSHDFASGLQIVPGVAAPTGFRANSGQHGLFLYLSFEHQMPGLKK